MPSTTTSSRKRKITEEASESPPKRQTRARAAKATQEQSTNKPKTTRITTASARVAAEARAVAKTATKAKTTTTKHEVKTTKDVAKPAKVQTKIDKSVKETSSRATTRVTKSKDEKPDPTATKTRSRKVKTTEPEVKRTVRTRSATIETEAAAKMRPANKKVTKRVIFQEDLLQEKENKPIPTKKETSTGIKAKPVRKIVKTPITARSRKPATSSLSKATPLSPKKVTQVAKGFSSSEDELVKTPPAKTAKSLITTTEEGSAHTELGQSPLKTKTSDTSVLLASPAKRPPPSPFKDALSQSPKKFSTLGVMPDLSKSVLSETNSESLKQPPVKFDFTPVRPVAGKSEIGAMARAALLRSPARRPASPLKLGSARTYNKTGAPRMLTNTTSIVRQVKDGSLFSATPRRLFKSPAKITLQSPTKELGTPINAGAMFTTQNPTISDAHAPTPYGFEKYSETARFGDAEEKFEHDVFEDSGHYRSLDNNSEDELSMGPLTSSPQKRAMLRKKLAFSPSAMDSPVKAFSTPETRAKNQFMTPLAVQLSNWLATSPNKPESEDDLSVGAFTPAARILQTNRSSRRTTMTPTCFEEQLPQIEVAATPEESMLDQDLHTKDDIDMVDDVVSDSTEEIIAATPEESLRRNDIAGIADQEYNMDVVQNSDQATESDLSIPEDMVVECVSTVADRDIMEDDNILMSDSSEHPAADETVIITRSLPGISEGNTHSIIEAQPQQSADILHELDTFVVIPVSDQVLSEDTEEYGDENCEPMLVEGSQPSPEVIAASKNVHTPVRPFTTRQKEIQTVARVPLKPSSDETPLPIKVRKGRSKSMSGDVVLAPITPLDDANGQNSSSITEQEPIPNDPTTPRSVSQPLKTLVATGDELITLAQTPFKSVRKGPDASILRGVTVHVDVHTSDGADASGIFVELLTQMGARCIKQWNWNPRTTLSGSEDVAANTKIGLTHVVFKDGSKRTLQKVREARGQVLCVGVGWVLVCERANKWLDEAPFAVDTSTIPRGGHNRRKSMEPTLLANLEGNLSSIHTPAKQARKSSRLSKSRKSSAAKPDMDETILLPFTPVKDDTGDIPVSSSPDSKNVELLQRTCPPKQSKTKLLPSAGDLEDQPGDNAKFRLSKARRKTMQFVPQIASPLSQEFAGED